MLTAIIFIFWPEEESLVESCLQSVAFADEVIVIDNGATPKTLEIIKKYTDKVYKTDSTNFAYRHNLGKEKASGDWIFYIDADERLDKRLAEEIAGIKNDFDAYQIFRVNYFLGKEVKFGDRVPDFVTRLFKKEKLQGWTGEIHESSIVDGKIGKLQFPLYHLTHRDIFSMIQKTINFSEHEAKLRLETNHPPVVGWRLLRVFLTEFFNRMVKYQGWRQGTEGWIDGIFQAFSLFIVYARLWEMQQRPSLPEQYKMIDQKIREGSL